MDDIERIKMLIMLETKTNKVFCEETGIDESRLKNIFSGRAKIRIDEIKKMEVRWPEYGYWIAYGKELTACGQISPIRKKL